VFKKKSQSARQIKFIRNRTGALPVDFRERTAWAFITGNGGYHQESKAKRFNLVTGCILFSASWLRSESRACLQKNTTTLALLLAITNLARELLKPWSRKKRRGR
jgi:hypothetical protein